MAVALMEKDKVRRGKEDESVSIKITESKKTTEG